MGQRSLVTTGTNAHTSKKFYHVECIKLLGKKGTCLEKATAKMCTIRWKPYHFIYM